MLRPVLKAMKSELGVLERTAKKKGGVGSKRLGELLRARVRLINGNEKQIAWRAEGKSDGDEETEGVEDGDEDAMDIDDGPAASEPDVFVEKEASDASAAVSQPKVFYPTTFVVRLGDFASYTAMHMSELRSATTPFSIKDVSYARFIALVSERLNLRGRGRIGAIILEGRAGMDEYTNLSVGSEAGWRLALRA